MNNNRITQEHIDNLLDSAEIEEHTFFGKDHQVCYKLSSNGFTVVGRGACVDPENFNIEIGRKVARQDASNQLWRLEGYRLQCYLSDEGIL